MRALLTLRRPPTAPATCVLRHHAHAQHVKHLSFTSRARPAFASSLPRLAFTASLLASLTVGCACLHTKSKDDDDSDSASSSTFTLPAPLKTLKSALSVLLYQPSSSPPTIHNPDPPPGPLPRLRYPVVLVHGFLGYSSLLTNPLNQQPLFEYFGELRQMYEDAGYTVIVPVLPRSYKVEKRAKALQVALGLTASSSEVVGEVGDRQTQKLTPHDRGEREQVQDVQRDASTFNSSDGSAAGEDDGVTVLTNKSIDLTTYKGPFHLIAHSMGGLDSRFLTTHLQPRDDNRILSLTTISSPHHGSPLADLIVEQVQKARILPIPAPTLSSPASASASPSFRIEDLVQFLSSTFHMDFRGMLDLTTSAAKDFNRDTPDRADTVYQSYSGWRPFDVWSVWYVPSKIIDSREGFNDGLVSVDSAKWGQWKGCLPLDHLQEIGLGVMHRHLSLYKEIAHGLKSIEDSRWRDEERRAQERRQGKRRHGGDGGAGDASQDAQEAGAVQRKEEARDRAKQKGDTDARHPKS